MHEITFSKDFGYFCTQKKTGNTYVDSQTLTQISHDLWALSDAHGTLDSGSRSHAHVPQTLQQRDGAIRRRLYRHRDTHLVFHWRSNLHSNENEHSKSMDAALGFGLHHTRNYALRVFEQHHVFDSCRESGVEHRLRTRHDARHPAD